jgi:predicted PurR-regulated permease PerM
VTETRWRIFNAALAGIAVLASAIYAVITDDLRPFIAAGVLGIVLTIINRRLIKRAAKRQL